MIFLSKILRGSSKRKAKQTRKNEDTLFRVCRRMDKRLTTVELQLSILRRDVARIDRNIYRELEGSREQSADPWKPPKGKSKTDNLIPLEEIYYRG